MSPAHGAIARSQLVPGTTRLLDSGNGLPTAKHASSFRLLRSAYGGSCIRVRRSSDNTTLDVGFVGGVLDTSSLLTFCGAGDGFITIAYDQSGNGLNAVYPTTASQERIVHSGAMETFGANSKPGARALNSSQGSSTNPFTAYTAAVASSAFVGGFSNQAASSPPQMVSLLPSDTTLTSSNIAGAILAGRKDSITSGKAETLVDNFTTQNTTQWSGWSSNVFVTGGQLSVLPNSTYNGIDSTLTYDLTESHVSAGLITRANAGNGTIENQLAFSIDGNNQLAFLVSATQLTMRERVGGTASDVSITYNATSHKYMRLRHTGTTIFWETSPDNTTWTTQRSKTPGLTLTAGTIQLQVGFYGTEPTVTAALWDNVNTVVAASATNTWMLGRSGTTEAFYSGVYAGANSIISVINGTQYTISVDGGSGSGTDTSTNLNTGSIGFGLIGNGQFANAQDCFWQERIVWLAALTSTQQTLVKTSQESYFGTVAVTGGSGGGNGGTTGGGGGGGGGGTGTRYNLEGAGYTLGATENFNNGTTRPSTVSTYDFGVMTSQAGAWMDNMVTVGPSVTGDGTNCLKVGIHYSSTLVNGYHVVGGAATMDDTSTFMKRGGAWEYRVRSDANQGTGFADLLWPQDPDNWPIKGEIDVREIYSNSSSTSQWHEGESNFHLDTVLNSGRHLSSPSSSTHSPSAMISAGNYNTDWTVWHIVQCIWNPDSPYIAVYIDGTLVGYTTDSSYVPHGSNAVPMRMTFQTEHYGATDGSVSTTTRYTEVDYIKYYSLP